MSPRLPLRYPKVFFVAAIVWLLAALAQCQGAEPPRTALRYQKMLTAEARLQWGLRAPVPLLGAQINQESRWHERVCSAFACGLTQFTPSTARWISGVYPKDLGGADVLNPQWAIRALVRYDHFLYAEVGQVPVNSDCDQWAFTLSAYNGGMGWVDRDRVLCRSAGRGVCNPSIWFGQVEQYSDRSEAAWRENREYPIRILSGQGPYRRWGESVLCSIS